MDIWAAVSIERSNLADALSGLSDSDWDTPSLSEDWTIRQVVGHVVATAQLTKPKFMGRFIGSGFSFQKLTDKGIAEATDGCTPSQLISKLRSLTDARHSPPGPRMTWLGETVVHGEDVTRAVGGYRIHPVDHLIAVADFYKDSEPLVHAKSRIKDIKLTANDTDWSTGDGPEAEGPLIALIMAMTGRKAALDDLTGDAVEILRAR